MNNSKEPKANDYNNHPIDILSTWYALEVLSPQTFKKPEDLAQGNSQIVSPFSYKELPWENERKRPPAPAHHDIFYHILLGSLNMNPINELLLKKFGDEFGERPAPKQKSALAFITVNAEGKIQEDNNIALSSFAWGYPQALKENLKKLSEWNVAESKLILDTFKIFFNSTERGERIPIVQDQINSALNYFKDELGILKDHLDNSIYFIQTYQAKLEKKKKDKEGEEVKSEEKQKYPDSPLLNSFYLKDLAKAKALFKEEDKQPGEALSFYMGNIKPTNHIGVLGGAEILQRFLSLAHSVDPTCEEKEVYPHTPLGRWPTPGGHSLVLLQQAAVNAGMEELQSEGLMGINGPPGTGKTTLLRDFIASILVNRAIEMAKFDDPEKAFFHKGKIQTSGNSFIHVYDIDNSLKGFEMMIASSNNKAVENITKELPMMDAINQDLPLPHYFRPISDKLNAKKGKTWGANRCRDGE